MIDNHEILFKQIILMYIGMLYLINIFYQKSSCVNFKINFIGRIYQEIKNYPKTSYVNFNIKSIGIIYHLIKNFLKIL